METGRPGPSTLSPHPALSEHCTLCIRAAQGVCKGSSCVRRTPHMRRNEELKIDCHALTCPNQERIKRAVSLEFRSERGSQPLWHCLCPSELEGNLSSQNSAPSRCLEPLAATAWCSSAPQLRFHHLPVTAALTREAATCQHQVRRVPASSPAGAPIRGAGQ